MSLSFVDVPGHERFIKNMLAGVGGIDFVLFIIAADESIKPQTREHFDICRLLQIPNGIIVLTKADLVDSDLVELVRLEVDEFVRGSFLEGAPVVAVSSVTGAGIGELKREMTSLAASRQSVITVHTVRGGAGISMAAWMRPAPSVSGKTSAHAWPWVSALVT